MSKNVLITGAAGFIGKNLALKFASHGYEVVGLGRGEVQEWMIKNIKLWHSCEVEVNSLLKVNPLPDLVLHCAGSASVHDSAINPRIAFQSTVGGMVDVLEYIRLYSPGSKLIYVSSAAIYGAAKHLPITENEASKPISVYGELKLSAERLCQMYARLYGLSILIVRPFSVYGEGLKKQLLWDACKKFSNNQFSFFGTGNEIRDWIHIKDLTKFLFVAKDLPSRECPIFNVGSGEGVPVKEILFEIGREFGISEQVEFAQVMREGDPSAYIADISRAKALGWFPQVNWKDGIGRYVDWYRS
jgi:UDP-glucose 4-epimerase